MAEDKNSVDSFGQTEGAVLTCSMLAETIARFYSKGKPFKVPYEKNILL